ncbi:aminopeptidase, putative [Talaromyces stipitatus ATCC 10500]|uniref:Peptide hydrolase n=1 Tax=Talaromyces stipitatus (strain ATCC 10500 / CBS 375.48 / QM 6759 / NRRL 1006) TaxID=441959 RepID=B8MDS6_TALSN|nr:aminopeptidase, putative [Talaromyces stipitatus ATCC 10500]EED18305.1 aminopeptidase, putative [Talaromyces stipitatus ATCC 10500]
MKLQNVLALGAAIQSTSAAAVPYEQTPLADQVPSGKSPLPQYLIELAPYDTRWVTEEEKWELKLDGVNFIDITEESKAGFYPKFFKSNAVQYPTKFAHNDTINSLSKNLNKTNMRNNLEHFTSFHTRYYKSEYGVESATWLYDQISDIVKSSGAAANGATVEKFAHSWGQFSTIARIPGKTNQTVVLGAHQDSINLFLPSILAAPGADDDGSGTVTILEVLRTLLLAPDIVAGNATNTIEFHWYSAEEGGLLGSQAVFSNYRQNYRDVKAMLQQDMTGFVQGTLDAGKEESVGVIVDFVDAPLTQFIKDVITQYCDIPFVETKCGYACSDHASASRYGYPSAFVIESEFQYSDKHIHSTDDLIKYLSFDHMLQHAKMSLAFAYELAYAPFNPLPSRSHYNIAKMDYEKELSLATLTIQRASRLTKSILTAVDKGALDKKDNTPVTIADFAAQALIISAIHAVFPDDGFVGEESAAALRENPELLERVWGLVSSFQDDEGSGEIKLATPSTQEEMLNLIDLGGKGQGGSKGRIWVLDPVDGTATFIRGQQYVVCLALLEGGEQKLGVLGCPNLPIGAEQVHEDIVDKHGDGQIIYAIAGQGAYIRPMNFSSTEQILLTPATPVPKYSPNLKTSDIRFVDCKASTSTNYEKHALVASKLGAPWPATVDLWSAQMRYVAVAVNGGGNTLIKILQDDSYRSCIWDHVGGMLIAQEVGCVVTDLRGRSIDCGLGRTLAGSVGLICAPASVHAEVLRAVQEVVDIDS